MEKSDFIGATEKEHPPIAPEFRETARSRVQSRGDPEANAGVANGFYRFDHTGMLELTGNA
jgi:hypothetical protein